MAFKMRSGNKTTFREMGSSNSSFKKDPSIDTISQIAKEKAYKDETGEDYALNEDMSDLKETDMSELQKQGDKKQNIFRRVFKPDTSVLEVDSEKQQKRRETIDEEGKYNKFATPSENKTKSYDIVGEDGKPQRVSFNTEEDADKYFRNIDKETGKQINPGDVAAVTGEPVVDTELSKLESEIDYKDKAQKDIDSSQFKQYWSDKKGEYEAGRMDESDILGNQKEDWGNRKKTELKDFQGDNLDLGGSDEQGHFEIPEWRQRQIQSQYLKGEEEEKAGAEQDIRDLATESKKTGVTGETDFSFEGELDPKLQNRDRRLVLDKGTGSIKEQAERKGKFNPVKLFSRYKDTGREKVDENWQGSVEELEKLESDKKNKKNKKNKPSKEEKENKKNKKKQDKANKEQLVNAARKDGKDHYLYEGQRYSISPKLS